MTILMSLDKTHENRVNYSKEINSHVFGMKHTETVNVGLTIFFS